MMKIVNSTSLPANDTCDKPHRVSVVAYATGFTLIETLVAVAIIALAVAGPLSAVNSGLVASYIARDQMTASYLAQEGAEYLRAVRDDAYLAKYPDSQASEEGWGDFLTYINPCLADDNPNKACTVDPSKNTPSEGLVTCVDSDCPVLYLKNNRYTTESTGGKLTLFTRTVQITTLSPTATEVRVTSKVSWETRGQPYSVTVSNHLTPWH